MKVDFRLNQTTTFRYVIKAIVYEVGILTDADDNSTAEEDFS